MASEIKIPGVLAVGTGDHWGTTSGLKDAATGKMQSAINADVQKKYEKPAGGIPLADISEEARSTFSADSAASAAAASQAKTAAETAKTGAETAKTAAEKALSDFNEAAAEYTQEVDAVAAERTLRLQAEATINSNINTVKNDVQNLIKDENRYDFSVNDDSGNAIVVFEEGHIRTKNFDSRNSVNTGDSNDVFSVEDEDGNAAFAIIAGYPQSQRFNGRDIANKVLSRKIYLVGDSITQGQTGLTNPQEDKIDDNSIADELAKIASANEIELDIINLGCGGERINDICARIGVVSLVIKKDFILKGDGTETSVFNKANNTTSADIVDSAVGATIDGSAQGKEAGKKSKSTGWINGIKVNVNHTSTSGETGLGGQNEIKISRVDVVDYDLTFKAGTILKLFGSTYNDGAAYVIMMGQNNLTTSGNDSYISASDYGKYVERVVSKLKNVFFLGLPTAYPNFLAGFDERNSLMKSILGDRYIDLPTYLSSYQSFKELGYTPTEDGDISSQRSSNGVVSDSYSIANGLLPSSFWRYSDTAAYSVASKGSNGVDKIHLNRLGYKAIATLIYKTLVQQNII